MSVDAFGIGVRMIHSPLLVVGCPRSGTSLLFNLLSEAPELRSIGGEGGQIIEKWHHPSANGWRSGCLTAADLTAASRRAIVREFERQAAPGRYWRQVNRLRRALGGSALFRAAKQSGQGSGRVSNLAGRVAHAGVGLVRLIARCQAYALTLMSSKPLRLLEKTPENCLRLPFLVALFPDARFIFLIRDGRANISSLIEGWKHPCLFHGYRPPARIEIEGNGRRGYWAFTLIPGWRELASAPLEEVCARQWIECNKALQEFENAVGHRVPIMTIRYEDLVTRPGDTLRAIADFAGVDYEPTFERYEADLPGVNLLTAPEDEKWRRLNRQAIQRIMPLIAPQMESLGYAV
jgi:hypothetical protein